MYFTVFVGQFYTTYLINIILIKKFSHEIIIIYCFRTNQLPTEQLSFLKNIFEKQKSKSQNGEDFFFDLESEDDDCIIVADSSQQIESMDFGGIYCHDLNVHYNL